MSTTAANGSNTLNSQRGVSANNGSSNSTRTFESQLKPPTSLNNK